MQQMRQRGKKPPKAAPRRLGARIHSELAAGIGTRILDGTYPPGTLLPNEAEWGRIFGASRTAVREAIKTLNGKGLLVSRPKVGSRVEPRERWNLLDRDVMAWHCAAMDKTAFLISLQEVRRILEPGAAVLAASRRTPEQLAELEAALEGMRNATDAEAMVAPDVRFHLSLLACANNELLSPFGIIIEQALANLFQYTTRHNAKPEQVVPMHEDVVKAVASQRPEAARKAMVFLLDDTDEVVGKPSTQDLAEAPLKQA
jgi:DNA-binding FadR family transcriptional regulator